MGERALRDATSEDLKFFENTMAAVNLRAGKLDQAQHSYKVRSNGQTVRSLKIGY